MGNTAKKLVRRCPRLGNTVPFHYCKICGDQQQPCFKILDCWWEHFDVVRYLKDHLPENDFNRLMAVQPKPKVSSLVELPKNARLDRPGFVPALRPATRQPGRSTTLFANRC
jgi:hypothetical protein